MAKKSTLLKRKFKEKDPSQWGRRSDPLESAIENDNSEFATRLGVLSRKYKAPGRTSVPDRIYFFDNNIVVFVEYKRFGKKPTPKQQAEINKMLAKGCYVYVIDNIKAGRLLIQRFALYAASLNV